MSAVYHVHDSEEHLASFFLKSFLTAHHAECLTRETTRKQIISRQIPHGSLVIYESHNVPHHQFVCRIIIGFIGNGRLTVNFRIGNGFYGKA